LKTTLKYRHEFVGGCTCNGKDNFGTAAISIYADLTLRPGDIVVTEKGMKVFVGSLDATHHPADFTSIGDYLGLSADERTKLLSMPLASTPKAQANVITFNSMIIFDSAPLENSLVPSPIPNGKAV
jgi:hypothetical protein